MDGLAKEYLIDFYSRQLLMHGDRPEALRWTPEGQRRRYSLLMEIAGDLNGAKVLDYGCGKGDLFGFMKEAGVRADYTGYDINPRLIELAGTRHPECVFEVLDVESDGIGGEFDYVFVCGVFSNRVQGVDESMRNVLRKLFDITKKGLALNALSDETPRAERAVELNYVSPAETLSFIKEHITPDVVRRDGIAGDLTLFMYKGAG